MKKKVLLLGATGMAGHIVWLFLKETNNYDVIPVVYRNRLTEDCILIDIRNKEQVVNLINSHKPDYIINCIGALVKESKDSPDNAILLNSYLPHLLARLADENNSKLIHISTDCVFSGKKGSYDENEVKDAEDVYGRSKALGEIVSDRHLTLRTSIIGPEIKKNGEGLFHWFMNQHGEVNGFTNAYWGGVTTLELAKAIEKAIENNLSGLMHVTNGEKISKYALISLIKEIWNKDEVQIKKYQDKPVDKSILKSTRFDFNIPGYDEMLFDQKGWMESHNELYSGYI